MTIKVYSQKVNVGTKIDRSYKKRKWGCFWRGTTGGGFWMIGTVVEYLCMQEKGGNHGGFLAKIGRGEHAKIKAVSSGLQTLISG